MKILLIHSADAASVARARKWRLKKNGLGEIYELSLVRDLAKLKTDPEASAYIDRQIKKARNIYGVEEIVWLD